MRKEMTMSEILSRIKLTKKKLTEPVTNFNGNNNMFVTTWNPNRDSIKGVPAETVAETFQSNLDSVTSNLFNLYKLLQVKETVNCTHKLTISNPNFINGGTVEMTVSEILVLKTLAVRDYYLKMLQRFKSEYMTSTGIVEEYEERCLSDKVIRDYVISRLSSLQKDTSKESIDACYDEYAKEYVDANKLEIYDPINVKAHIDDLQNWYDEFYNEIDYKLSEFNAKTKVWIDLDLDENFWGYIEE